MKTKENLVKGILKFMGCLALGCVGLTTLAEVGVTLPTGMTSAADWTDENPVKYGDTFYATLQKAVEAAYDAKDANIFIYCKPGATVGKMSHAHVVSDITVYGNGASVAVGGDADFEVDTYKGKAGPAGSELTGDITLNIYNLNGCAVWGQRNSEYKVTINLTGCQNVNRIYFSTAKGTIDINVDNCSFVKKNDSHANTSIKTDSQGTWKITNTTFDDIAVAIAATNENGPANVTVENCTFIDCATKVNAAANSAADYASPIRVLGRAETALKVDGCSFSYSEGQEKNFSDIVIGEIRANKAASGTVSYEIVNTVGEIDVIQPHEANVTIADISKKITVTEATKSTPVKGDNEAKAPAVAKIGDVEYETLAAAIAAAETGDKVEIVKADTYSFPSLPKNITLSCCDGVVFNCEGSGSISSVPNGCTVIGGTFNMGQKDYHGWQHAGAMAFENSTFNGKFFGYGSMTFTGCHFVQTAEDYCMWTYSSPRIDYIKCTFDCKGKAVNVYWEDHEEPTEVTADGCTFNSSKENKPALKINSLYGAFVVATTSNNTLSGFPRGISGYDDEPGEGDKAYIVTNAEFDEAGKLIGGEANCKFPESIVGQYFAADLDTVSNTEGETWKIGVKTEDETIITTKPQESKVEVPQDVEIAAEVQQKIEQNTKVEGVKLSASADEGKTSGIVAVVEEAKKDQAFAAAVEAAAEVSVKVEVKVEPKEYDNTPDKGVVAFKLTPKATVTVKQDETELKQVVDVTNDMIDQNQKIAVSIYTGFKPVAITHDDDDGFRIETFEGDQIAYNEETCVATVLISHFSILTSFGNVADVPPQPVAQIVETGVKYPTLAEAVAAVEDGQTIKLLTDMTEVCKLGAASKTTNPTITFDLNGHTIYNKVQYGSGSSGAKATFVIKNGTIDVRGENLDTCAIHASGSAPACKSLFILENLTLYGYCKGDYAITGQIDAAYGDVRILSGTYIIDENAENGISGWATYYGGTVQIMGGTFSPTYNVSGYLAPGCYIEKDADGNQIVLVDNSVAEIEGGAKFDSLEEAMLAARDGDTVNLLKDMDGRLDVAFGTATGAITLNLNGHVIAGGVNLNASENPCDLSLTIKGGTIGSVSGETSALNAIKIKGVRLEEVTAYGAMAGQASCPIVIVSGNYHANAAGSPVDNYANSHLTFYGGAYDYDPMQDATSVYNALAPFHECGKIGDKWIVSESQYPALEPDGDGVYHIATVENLLSFRDMVNSGNKFAGKVVKLDADLDLTAILNWTRIGGSNTKPFSGTFDGQNYKISNLTIANNNDPNGFFGYVTAGRPETIKNLTFENVSISAVGNVGTLAGIIYTGYTVSNVNVTGTIRITGSWYLGGIQGGMTYSKYVDCHVDGLNKANSFIRSINGSGESAHVGGILGHSGEGAVVLDGCTVDNITFYVDGAGVGGIVGLLQYGTDIRDCAVENIDIVSGSKDNLNAVGYIAGRNVTSAGGKASKVINSTATDVSAELEEEDYDPPVVGRDGDTNRTLVGTGVEYDDDGKVVSGEFELIGVATMADIVVSDKTVISDPDPETGKVVVKKAVCVIVETGVKYATLEAAAEDSEIGDTIKLLADVDLTNYAVNSFNRIVIEGVTLDLDGHTITSNNGGVVYDGDYAVIRNGSFVAANGGSYALFVGDGLYEDRIAEGILLEDLTCSGGINVLAAEVTIRGGTVNDTNVTGTNYYAVWGDEASDVTVESGFFSTSRDDRAVLLADATGSVKAYGGYYNRGVIPECVADDYKCVKNTDPDTSAAYPWTVTTKTYVAAVISLDGTITKKCETLAEAFDAAEDGQTVRLLVDCGLTGDDPYVLVKSIDIDLNGMTLALKRTAGKTTRQMLYIGAEGGTDRNAVTLYTGVEGGKVTFDDQGGSTAGIRVNGSATLTIGRSTTDKPVAFESNKMSVWAAESSHVIVNNADMKSTGASTITTNGSFSPRAVIDIYGGTFESTAASDTTIYNPAGDLHIYGGTFKGVDAVVWIRGGSLTIEGGVFSATGVNQGGLDNGDAIVIDSCDYPAGVPVVHIMGGKFSSLHGKVVGSYASQAGAELAEKFVSGGIFNKAVDENLIAAGYRSADNEDEATRADYPKTVTPDAYEPPADDPDPQPIVAKRENGEIITPITVPDVWVEANVTHASGVKPTSAEVNAALDATQANGLKGWQNMTMGIDGKNAANTLTPDYDSNKQQAEDENITVRTSVARFNPPPKVGMKATYRLMKSVDRVNWTQVGEEMSTPKFPLSLHNLGPETYWKIQAVFKAVTSPVAETEAENANE